MFSFISYYYYKLKTWLYPPNNNMLDYNLSMYYEPLLRVQNDPFYCSK